MEDLDKLISQHGGSGYNWISSFVYGGMDGAITTFALVAGVEGASLSLSIILILGFVNLFASGFSMSVGRYVSDKAELDQYEKIRNKEFEHIRKIPEVETQEVKMILEDYGLEGITLDEAVEIITSDEEKWVDLMMRNEFNMTKENLIPINSALVTFAAFILIGFIPLAAYIFVPIFNGVDLFGQKGIFILASIFTLFALFIVGIVKSRFAMKNWFISGFETVFIGGVAAFIAYFVGYFLSRLV